MNFLLLTNTKKTKNPGTDLIRLRIMVQKVEMKVCLKEEF